MKKVKIFPLLLMMIIAFGLNIRSVSADITNVSVTPQIDSGDTDKFEMVVKSGEKRSLTIAFTNFGSSVERLAIQPTNAQTDATGNFVYNQVVKKGTAGLQQAFADMTSKKTITLQPQESKTETLVVNTPSERFDGVIYGGFNIYSVNANGGHLNSESTPIPVIITQTNQNVPGNGKVTGIVAQAIAYQPNIVIKLENSKPGEAKNVSYNLMIQRKGMFSFLGFNGRKVPVYQSNLSIAPNSILPVPVNYKQQPLTPGEYMITGSFTINGKTHKVKENYNISKADAEKVNKQSKGLIYDKTWIFILVIIGLIILIGIVIFLIIRQIRYNRREENNRLVAESDKMLKSDQLKNGSEDKDKSAAAPNYGQSNVGAPNPQRAPQQMPYNNPYPNNLNNLPNQGQQGTISNGQMPNPTYPQNTGNNNQQAWPNQNPYYQGPNQQVNPNYAQPPYANFPSGQQNPQNNLPNQNQWNPGNQVNNNSQQTPANGQNWQQNYQTPPYPGNYNQPPQGNYQGQGMQQAPGSVSNPNSAPTQPTANPNDNQSNDGWDDLSLDDLLKKH
ncbi:WxL protein peptidoglycan domain-containing protein [Xylocopilactobacillus apicola]|uniref:Cell surface protein n=1 Tax=Xylocopilactobacillus apicola TaxID=2932184 RepID=A0AAU9DVK6_9LACO|nr:DUF916 domain-containing protein [Xylocopilactobacillus apicola]BDR57888.1 hypothetical protein XA3_03290 [Xylocopilactobacillus apicola]